MLIRCAFWLALSDRQLSEIRTCSAVTRKWKCCICLTAELGPTMWGEWIYLHTNLVYPWSASLGRHTVRGKTFYSIGSRTVFWKINNNNFAFYQVHLSLIYKSMYFAAWYKTRDYYCWTWYLIPQLLELGKRVCQEILAIKNTTVCVASSQKDTNTQGYRVCKYRCKTICGGSVCQNLHPVSLAVSRSVRGPECHEHKQFA